MKKIIVILTVMIFIIGFITSILNSTSFPNELLFSNNNFFFFLNLLIIIASFGLTFICLPAFLFVYLFESFMMGFCTFLFLLNFGLKGIIFIVFLLIYKLIMLFFLLLNSFYYIKYIIHLFNYFFKKIYISKHNIKLYLKKITIITCFILILLVSYYGFAMKVLIPMLNKLL